MRLVLAAPDLVHERVVDSPHGRSRRRTPIAGLRSLQRVTRTVRLIDLLLPALSATVTVTVARTLLRRRSACAAARRAFDGNASLRVVRAPLRRFLRVT